MHLGVPEGKVNQGQSKQSVAYVQRFPTICRRNHKGKQKSVSTTWQPTEAQPCTQHIHSQTPGDVNVTENCLLPSAFCPFNISTVNVWAINSTLNSWHEIPLHPTPTPQKTNQVILKRNGDLWWEVHLQGYTKVHLQWHINRSLRKCGLKTRIASQWLWLFSVVQFHYKNDSNYFINVFMLFNCTAQMVISSCVLWGSTLMNE